MSQLRAGLVAAFLALSFACDPIEAEEDAGVDAGAQADAGQFDDEDAGEDAGETFDAGPGDDDAGTTSDAGNVDAGPEDAGRSDGGSSDAGRPDAGGADAGLDAGGSFDAGPGTPVLVAFGSVGRTMLSCNGGESWIRNRSDDDNMRCVWDHSEIGCAARNAASGIAIARGSAVILEGWAYHGDLPAGGYGTLRRTNNGINFTTLASNLGHGGFGGNDDILVMGPPSGITSGRNSTNLGVSWSTGYPVIFDAWNIRRFFYLQHGPYFVSLGDDGPNGQGFGMSNDGRSFRKPSTYPATCGLNIRLKGGAAAMPGVLTIVSGDGVICRTTNNGQTWSTANIPAARLSHMVSKPNEMLIWGDGKRYRSTDGLNFTAANLTNTNLSFSAVGYDPLHGRYVAVSHGYQAMYEAQRFYVSTDGLSWRELTTQQAPRSHPIKFFEFGALSGANICP